MKLVLTIDSKHTPRVTIERAIAGLVATTDEGAAIVTALEALVEGPRCAPSTRGNGTPRRFAARALKATAKALGIARSTVRARRARALAAGYTLPTIDADNSADEWVSND